MGVHEDGRGLHQGRHAQRVAGVFAEHQEGRAVGDEAAVQGDAVHDGGHAELAHAVVDVVAVVAGGVHVLAALPQGQVGAGQVGGAAQQFRQQRPEAVQGVLRRLAAGDGLALRVHRRDEGGGLLGPVLRQFAVDDAALELGGQLGEVAAVVLEAVVPRALVLRAGLLRAPAFVNVGGDLKRRGAPAQGLADQGDFVGAQRRAVALFLALLVRRAEADDGLRADQGRLVGDLAGRLDGGLDRVGAVAVDLGDDVPAVGLEAGRGVVQEPAGVLPWPRTSPSMEMLLSS